MVWPIFLSGAEAGTLTETREGLYRVFRADCASAEGLHRLYLHGASGSAALGLLRPEAGRLRLCRRFSRLEEAALPRPILSVSDSETPGAAPKAAESGEEAAPVWHALADGSLLGVQGERRFLALPAALLPGSAAAGRLRRIGGKDYLVFRL